MGTIKYPPQSAPGIGDIPCSTIGAVTTSDSTDLSTSCRWMWVGGAGSGNLKVTMVDGSIAVLKGVEVGVLKLNVKRIWATGTDVTDIVGFI